MRTNEQLKSVPHLLIVKETDDGGCGELIFEEWKGSVIWSNGMGWEHVSVSPYKHRITPSWDDMCRVKRMFFDDEEAVVQYHPAKSEYVDVMQNCLHLWRPIDEKMPMPPMICV